MLYYYYNDCNYTHVNSKSTYILHVFIIIFAHSWLAMFGKGRNCKKPRLAGKFISNGKVENHNVNLCHSAASEFPANDLNAAATNAAVTLPADAHQFDAGFVNVEAASLSLSDLLHKQIIKQTYSAFI